MCYRGVGLIASILLIASGTATAQTGPARLVKDIDTTPTSGSGSGPDRSGEFRGMACFTGFTLEPGTELWKSDGTETGTVLVKDVRPGPESSSASRLTVVGDTLLFYANDGIHGAELWKTDGTETGTVLV